MIGSNPHDWLRDNIVQYLTIADEVLAEVAPSTASTLDAGFEKFYLRLLRRRQVLEATLAEVERQIRKC